jgi:RNA polymerase sigma-70 factor (ECF subfamily)
VDLPDSPNLDQIVNDLSQPLRRYLTRLTGDSTIAEDLLQETLIRIAKGLPGFAGRSSMKTWGFSIATRVAADHFRKPVHRVQLVEMDESPELTDHDITMEQRLVIDEMNHCVREVIDSLPEDYRAALVLHDLEGHTAAEVAAVCDCSVPTAKIRIHRARARLRAALQDQCEFYRDSESVLRCDRKTDSQ